MCLKTHSPACGSIFSATGVYTNTDAFSMTLDFQKEGDSQWGYSHRRVSERKCWAFCYGFKISILVILYGSGCFDLAAARYVCERERDSLKTKLMPPPIR